MRKKHRPDLFRIADFGFFPFFSIRIPQSAFRINIARPVQEGYELEIVEMEINELIVWLMISRPFAGQERPERCPPRLDGYPSSKYREIPPPKGNGPILLCPMIL